MWKNVISTVQANGDHQYPHGSDLAIDDWEDECKQEGFKAANLLLDRILLAAPWERGRKFAVWVEKNGGVGLPANMFREMLQFV